MIRAVCLRCRGVLQAASADEFGAAASQHRDVCRGSAAMVFEPEPTR